MKKTLFVLTIFLSLFAVGCKSPSNNGLDSQIIQNQNDSRSLGAFNDKKYVWENWETTNKSTLKQSNTQKEASK